MYGSHGDGFNNNGTIIWNKSGCLLSDKRNVQVWFSYGRSRQFQVFLSQPYFHSLRKPILLR